MGRFPFDLEMTRLEHIDDLIDWTEKDNRLSKTFRFPSFAKSIAFVTEVAKLSEAMDHHPYIMIDYRKVTLSLCTHSAGHVVTEKDRLLAKQISVIAPGLFSNL